MKLSDLKVDSKRAEEGDWVENIPECDGLRLKVRGINNSAFRKLQQRLIEAIPRKKRLNRQIDIEDMDRITNQCLLQTCLDDWDGIVNSTNNEPVPYSKEQARVMLTDPDYRPFRDAVLWAATYIADQQAEQQEEISKN